MSKDGLHLSYFRSAEANLGVLFWNIEPKATAQENFSFPLSRSKNKRKSEAKLYKG